MVPHSELGDSRGRGGRVRHLLSLVALLPAMVGCSCSGLAEFFSDETRSVVHIDGGGPIDGGALGYCDRPWVEVVSLPELRPPWSGGPLSDYGLVRRLYADGGLREVVLTVADGEWSVHDTHSQMYVAVLGDNGDYCGQVFDAGQSYLRIEFRDGGVSEPPISSNCLAYNNGWWTSWDRGQVLRGKDMQVETLGNMDAGLIPGVIPPGVPASVQAVSAEGEVAIYVNTATPGSYLLPSGVRLQDPQNLGFAIPLGITSKGPYGFNSGLPTVPLTWSYSGEVRPMETGGASAHFSQVKRFRGYSDGHFCAGITRTDGLSDAIAFWRQDGGFVSPEVFATGDAGMRILSDLNPADCWPVGPDWYLVVYYREPGHLIDQALVRVRLDCIP